MANEREIYLIRHGATEFNEGGDRNERTRGWIDLPLSFKGRLEVDKTARRLESSGLEALYTSDLKRAWQTAETIAEMIGATVYKDKDLRPWDLGKFSGKNCVEVAPSIRGYVRNKPDEAIPGGETFNTFRKRVMGGIADLLGRHEKDVGLVTHHRTERLIKSWIAQGQRPDGEFCYRTFEKPGERTAGYEVVKIDLDALRQAAKNIQGALQKG